jgi:two-component system LytT family response regulator
VSKIRIAIVDDELLARDYLRSLLEEEDEVEIVFEAANGRDAAEKLSSTEVDIVFLDVQMPGLNGLEVIERVGVEKMPLTIFVTAFDRYALDAFEQHALDYLVKPFDDARFHKALDRARKIVHRKRTAGLGEQLQSLLVQLKGSKSALEIDAGADGPIKRIPVKIRDKVVFVTIDEIDWIESADYCSNLHCGKRTFTIRESMKWLEENLDSRRFARIHRGAIVNLDRVVDLRPYGGGDYEVNLADGTRLRLSRRRKADLEKLLGRSF